MAFAGALVLTPLVVALLFFWLLLIPVFAVVIGAVPYLVFGTPVLLWMVARYPLDEDVFAYGGMAAYLVFVLFSSASLALSMKGMSGQNDFPMVVSMLIIFVPGLFFAGSWFAAFSRLYRRFYRPITR